MRKSLLVLFLVSILFISGCSPQMSNSKEIIPSDQLILPGLCDFLIGDLNLDRSIDVLDVAFIVDCIIQKDESCSNMVNFCSGDFNNDGKYTIFDILLLVKQINEEELDNYVEDEIEFDSHGCYDSDSRNEVKKIGEIILRDTNCTNCFDLSSPTETTDGKMIYIQLDCSENPGDYAPFEYVCTDKYGRIVGEGLAYCLSL